jgi:hypothetical protein
MGKIRIEVRGPEADVNEVVRCIRAWSIDGWEVNGVPPATPSSRRLTRLGAFYDGLAVGVLATWAWLSLRQDYLGLDGYIATVRAGWVDWRYTVPLAVVALVACLVVGVGTLRRARAADSVDRP